MKCQLIGYQFKEGTDRETGRAYKCCTLYFVRNPSLSESGVSGNVCFFSKLYDENIDKLPELNLTGIYSVDGREYKGRFYIDEMSALK